MSVGARLQGWFAELRRRKVIRVAGVYLVVAWLAIQVADAVFEPLGLPGWALRLLIVAIGLGFPLACALAWAFDVTPAGIERTAPGAVPVPQSAPRPAPVEPARSGLAMPVARPAPVASVAILPFVDLSPGRDQEYFCDGIAAEIGNAVCCVRGLRVASRTSSSQFKGRATDVREIGRALGVGAVVEDVFATQSEIAQQLVRALRVTLTSQETSLLGRGGTRNPDAYDLYLRGQALLREGGDALPTAAEHFARAAAADPGFAQAHAGLASALAYAGIWGLSMGEGDLDRALAASRRALELEPSMPEAYVAKGNLLFLQRRAADAFAAFEQALSLDPSSYEANYFYARDLFSAGRAGQAVAYYEAAERLRPDEYQPPCMLAGALYALGRRDQADIAAARAIRVIDARLAERPDDVRALHLGAVLAGRSGKRERALQYVDRAMKLRPHEFATDYNVACAYAVLEMREEALAALDRALQHGRGDLGWIEHDPDFEGLRGEPRFEAIVGRLRAAAGREAR